MGTEPIKVYHSDPLVAFGIEDDKYFNNGYMRNDILFNTSFEPEQEIRFEFIKSGAWSANDPNAAFYEEFYKQENLILPAGEYVLSANLKYSTDIDNMLETRQEITTSIDIETDD